MALKVMSYGGVVALGYDSATGERGFLTKQINRTGHTSIKGEGVSCSTTADNEVVLQSTEYDCIGVIAESGVPQGSEVWVWDVGSICQVLYENSHTVVRGELLICSAVDGRFTSIDAPGAGIPAVDTHFKEAGHVRQSVASGIDQRGLAKLHFN